MMDLSICREKGEETEHSKQSLFIKNPRNPKYLIHVVFTIGPPNDVRNEW